MLSSFQRRVGQENCELLPAESGDQVGGTRDLRAQRQRNGAQALIAGLMAESIVEFLK